MPTSQIPTKISSGERSGLCGGHDVGLPLPFHQLQILTFRFFVPHNRSGMEHHFVETKFHLLLLLLLVQCHQVVARNTTRWMSSLTVLHQHWILCWTLPNVWDKLNCTVMTALLLASQVMHCAFPCRHAIILNDCKSGSAYCCSKCVMYFH